MPRTVYVWMRDLHLCTGLFFSPFVLLFAISTFLLNHPPLPSGASPGAPAARTISGIRIPGGLERLSGMEQIERLRPILRQTGISGEVTFVRYLPTEGRLVVPVSRPGETATLDLNLQAGTATVLRRKTGLGENLTYLHKFPGPHLQDIRGNWVYTRVWKWLADGTAYGLLFLASSGVYLWAVWKAERRTGLVLFGAGVLSFGMVVYALAR